MNCRHCYHKKELNDKSDTPLSEWRRRFASYKKDGMKYILLLGGEPTMRLDVMRAAEDYFPFISTFTNGLVKIPAVFNRRIHLSLDGLEGDHDYIRRSGSFRQAVDNYTGDKRVIVNTIISKMNYKGPEWLQEFIDFVRQMETSGLLIEFFFPQTDEPDSYNYVLDQEQYEEIGEVLLKELARKDNIMFTTPHAVKSQVNNDFPYKHCNIRDINRVINAKNRTIRCVGDTNDCNYCRILHKYHVPFYKFPHWWKIKRVRSRYNLYQV
jgi:MoaA/NifB/PqqE/SkfB family radical SAM enzyme